MNLGTDAERAVDATGLLIATPDGAIAWRDQSASNLLDRLGWGDRLPAGLRDAIVSGTDDLAFTWRAPSATGALPELAIRCIRPAAIGDRVLLHLTDARRVEGERRQVRMLAQAIVQTGDSVMIADAGGTIEYVNPAFEQITGYSRAEAIGRRTSLLKSGVHSTQFFVDLWRTIRDGRVFRAVFTNRRKDGRLFHEEKTISPIRDANGRISHFVSTAKDVTARVLAEERLAHMANYDVLTQLPNRSLFADRLRQAILRAQRDGREVALLFIDLDKFKIVNDSLGHGTGDRLLVMVGERLKACLRQQDTVARLGGDEFTLILEEVDDTGGVLKIVDKLLAAFDQPFVCEGGTFFLGMSIGIARYPHDGQDQETLLKHADIAMYKAKALGGKTHAFFDSRMSGTMVEDLSLETALHGALERGEFRVVYQPVVAARGRRVVGYEALMRWERPGHGMVMPGRFIPLLESNGLIVPATLWLMREAMRRLRDAPGQPRLAVNISGRHFRHPRFLDDVTGIIVETGFNPRQLVVEITESVLIENTALAIAHLDALRAMGVYLAVDDFGTGYSSLSYLRRFALTTLKIDRSFVAEVETSGDARAIAHAVVDLANGLGLDVVAEGIETEGQQAILATMGCHMMQGYLFGRPESWDAASDFREAGKAGDIADE